MSSSVLLSAEEELAELVAEQEKDSETYMVSRSKEVSMDAPLSTGGCLSDLIGYDDNTGEILDFTPRESVTIGEGRHGTNVAYIKSRCRCRPCTSAHATYERERYAKKRTS